MWVQILHSRRWWSRGAWFKNSVYLTIHDFISSSTDELKGVVREVGGEGEIPKGICQEYQFFMSVIYLKSLRIRNIRSGQKGAPSASRGQSLLEHFFLNCLKPLLKTSRWQVGRSLQEFYLQTETSSKFSFKHELNLKQVFPFDSDGGACVGACTWYFYIHSQMSLKPTKRFLPQATKGVNITKGISMLYFIASNLVLGY